MRLAESDSSSGLSAVLWVGFRAGHQGSGIGPRPVKEPIAPCVTHVYDMLRCLVALRIYSVSVACREAGMLKNVCIFEGNSDNASHS